MVDQAEIHRMARSEDVKERKKAADELKNNFANLKDKNQAWEDLHRLTSDADSDVRGGAASTLGRAFSRVPDKKQAWEDLQRLTFDIDWNVHRRAATALGRAFSHVLDKKQAWEDLHRLTSDIDNNVRKRAAGALGIVFSHIIDKKQAWEDLHRLTSDTDRDVRGGAAGALGSAFSHVPDKKQAWDDLHRLTSDVDCFVRKRTAGVLGFVFSHEIDMKQAWDDLHRLTSDIDSDVRKRSTGVLGFVFSHIIDKKQAWEDLHRLTSDTDSDVRRHAASALGSAFMYLPDKKKAWDDLHRFTSDTDNDVRRRAASALGIVFFHVIDKKQAWEDLHRLTSDIDSDVRKHAAFALGIVFSHIIDKKQAWEDLHRLTSDTDNDVRRRATSTLGSTFSQVIDKKQAWEDLHRLTSDTDNDVRMRAASGLGIVFFHVIDKKQAWEDLHRFTSDIDSDVRKRAASALGRAFSNVPDKKQAWQDMHKLTTDTERSVRWGATRAIGKAFSNIIDKEQAWEDLHRLTADIESFVRQEAASALGIVLSNEIDKKQAWQDLHRLTSDTGSGVRASAYHSLGKASIFKAANAENDFDFKKEMETAIGYFEKSSKQSTWSEPAKFCLPFYRSFYTLTFRKEETETEVEVQKYIAEAKSAVEDSDSKEKLLEAVENLGNALKEAIKARDFNDMKFDLNAYRRYIEHACELLDTTEEKAPGASRLIRKGLPIIDERINGIIAEIQEKAKALCKKTRGTSLEEMGLETVKQANELSTSNEIKLDKSLGLIVEILNKFSEYIPADKRDGIIEELTKTKYLDIPVMVETIAKKLEDIYKNFAFPPIITVSANKENKQKKDIVRIAAIQLGSKLTNSFPPALEKKEECKQKIISALDIAKCSGAHIACLPELCMCEEWVPDIKDRYPDMIIIGGSYYKNDFNECPVIMNIKVPPQLKKSPSRPEDPEITGRGMKSGDKLYRYETQFGTFSVLVCIDFLNYAKFCDQTDIIFCPSYNEAKGIERFHEYANSHVTNTPSYIIISNTALFGGTSIFGQLHRDYYRGLVENGCKKSDDDSYKLCDLEKGFEGIIIADFDMVHKSSQVPTPADSNKVIKSIKNIRKINIS